MSTNIDNAITTLDAYEGDNIWQDVIFSLDGYDDDASVALGADQGSDVVVIDGTVIRYWATSGWFVAGQVETATLIAHVQDVTAGSFPVEILTADDFIDETPAGMWAADDEGDPADIAQAAEDAGWTVGPMEAGADLRWTLTRSV